MKFFYPFHRSFAKIFLVLFLLGVPNLSLAASPERLSYDGHKVVTVYLADEAKLQKFFELTNDRWDIWSHGVGIGPVDVQVSPEQLEALRQSGLPFEVKIHDLGPLVKDSYALPPAGADFYDVYHPLNEIIARVNEYAQAHPDIVQVFTMGQSLNGVPLTAFRITGNGDPTNKPGIFIHAGQHAREWITEPVVMYAAEWLLNNYGTDPRATALVDNLDWTILPVMNPDGYSYSWTSDRYWRKNRRNNGGGSYGVDLNRNWGYQWGGPGGSTDPWSETYRGTGAFSEPETQVVRDYILSRPNIRGYIDFHNYGQLVMWPWAYTTSPPPDYALFSEVGTAMASLIQQVHGTWYQTGSIAPTLYYAAGCSIDWVYGANVAERMILSYVIELRDQGQYGFALPPNQILPTSEELLPAVLYLAEWIMTPLTVELVSSVPDVLPPDQSLRVEARVSERSGSFSGDISLFYRINGGNFTEVAMRSLGNNRYEGTIPPGACKDHVEFYIVATSDQGDQISLPQNAPNATFSYDVDDPDDLCFEGSGIPCEDIQDFRVQCGLFGTLSVVVVMTDRSHDGESLRVTINSERWSLDINGRLATLLRFGQRGRERTVTLVDPPRCFAPRTVQCR